MDMIDEDEFLAVQLAEELSLEENYRYGWDPRNLHKTKTEVRVLEEILDTIEVPTPDDLDDEALTNEQVKEIFCTEFVPEEAIQTDNQFARNRRPSSRGREMKIKETVGEISRSLNWYRSKIVEEIQSSNEAADLTGLLNLKDQVTSALERVQILTQGGGSDRGSFSTQQRTSNDLSIHPTTTGRAPAIAPIAAARSPTRSAGGPNGGSFLPSVISAVYAVKRGGTREEVAQAVDNLIYLCNLGAETNMENIKNMTSAGALQALLTLLPKAHDWPDIEVQIFKIVSMLVSYEDDWALLQRSAMIILTSLYTLHIKTQVRVRTRSSAIEMEALYAQSTGGEQPQMNESVMEMEHQTRLVRELVSAAVDKLSLVLSIEWSKEAHMIGDLAFLSTVSPKASSNFGYDRFDRYDSSRPLSGHYHSNTKRSTGNKGNDNGADGDNILEILLNLIKHLWESVSTSEPMNFLRFLSRGTSSSNLSTPSEGLDESSAHRTNDFLLKAYGITLDQLMIGDCPHDIKNVIDNSAVLCSAALANLAEVQQCRPGLVDRGALQLIKSWMEVGIIVLKQARVICFECLPAVLNHSDFYDAFIKLFGPAYELLANATEALMFLTGGSYGVKPPTSFSNSGRDYIIGWVDAQILNEGLPEVIERLVKETHEDFLTLKGNAKTRTRSILPAIICLNLSQAIFQLRSRAKNRYVLQGNTIPLVLCTIFENAFGHILAFSKHQGGVGGAQGGGDEDESDDPIFRRIFEFGTAMMMMTTHTTNTPSSHVSLYDFDLSPRNTTAATGSRSNSMKSRFGHRLSRMLSYSDRGSKVNNTMQSPMLDILSSLATACLDALNSFFADETQQRNRQQRRPSIPGFPDPSVLMSNSMMMVPAAAIAGSGGDNFLKLMCNHRVIAAILSATSHLRKGAGRLSSVRVVSSLTEWPETLKALYDGSVMDALLVIIYEAEGGSSSSKEVTMQTATEEKDETSSLLSSFRFPKTSTLERNISGNSSISGISSSAPSKAGGERGGIRSRSQSFQKMQSIIAGHNYDHHYYDYHDSSQDHNDKTGAGSVSNAGDDEYQLAEMTQEETLIVCYSLANLCTADDSYALRMFNSGLVTLMTRLVKNPHFEISKQALRCMHAMCKVVAASHQIEEPKSPVVVGHNANSKAGKYGELYHSLDTIMDVLQSPSSLIQRRALLTIAQLALIGEDFQDKVVDECLRTIASMLVNPKSDKDVKNAAEEVLKNLGFSAGYKDFELCGFDFEIFRDWYAIQRSLGPQETSMFILRDWIYHLFAEDDPYNVVNEQMALQQEHNAGGESYSEFHLISQTANILHTNYDTNSMPAYLVKDHDHSHYGRRSSSSTRAALVTMNIPHLQRHLTESLLRFWPFCMPRVAHSMSSSSYDEDTSLTDGVRSKSKDNSPFHGQQMMRGVIAPPSNTNNNAHINAYSHSFNLAGATHGTMPEPYRWIDKPPAIVIHLLDLFYSSRIHQLVLMDLTSIGACFERGELITDDDNNAQQQQEMSFLIPVPHPVSAILLPSRLYQSFGRVSRVLQRMFEYVDQSKLFSLSFRDSVFEGEFHTSLLDLLNRCHQICSLSFSNQKRVEEDALLGHLVGQLPSSVRFISFKGTLSRQSVMTLCVLLRTQNAAFSSLNDEDARFTLPSNARAGSNTRKQHAQQAQSQQAHEERRFEVANRGLLGLALTHLGFDQAELSRIEELLNPRAHPLKQVVTPITSRRSGSDSATTPNNTPGMIRKAASMNGYDASNSNNTSFSSPPGYHNKRVPTPTSASFKNDNNALLRGLKYLDLSRNELTDAQCASLLAAAIKGPLEGFELGGNNIHSGVKLLEVMTEFTTVKAQHQQPNRIRYLGLSQNGLHTSTVTKLLTILKKNTSITTLDLSANHIDGNATINEALKEFLFENDGLRVLDMSYNRLNPDSYKAIQLGLLNNNFLLMLPLAGNIKADVDRSIELVQMKLRKNRVTYKLCSSRGFLRGDSFYQTEDIFSRWTFSEADFNSTEVAVEGEDTDTTAQLAMDGEDNIPVAAVESVEAALLISEGEGERVLKRPPSLMLQRVAGVKNPSYDGSSTTVKTAGIAATATANAHDDHGSSLSLDTTGIASSTSLAVAIPVELQGSSSSSSGVPQPSPRRGRSQSSALVATVSSPPKPSSHKIGNAINLDHEFNSIAASSTMIDNGIDKIDEAVVLASQMRTNTLHVLFSAPLAGYDRNGKAHPMEVLDYASERDSLVQVFKEARRDVALHFDFATTNALRTLLSFGCKALHFSGHGIPNGLCFEDGRSGLQIIGAAQLRDLLGAGGLSCKFVFVSACFSKEIGEAFVKAGVSHVVCVKVDTKIQDSAAMAFTRAFYVAFLTGRSVRDSFKIAKEALKASPYVPNSVVEGEKFILLPDDQSNLKSMSSSDHSILVGKAPASSVSSLHDEIIFPSGAGGTGMLLEWPQPGLCTIGANRQDVRQFLYNNSRLPRPPADFEGREVVMNWVIRNILDRRLVSLVGDDGIGKSAVSAAVCRYMADREMFPTQIIYLKGKGIKDFRGFLLKLKQELRLNGFSIEEPTLRNVSSSAYSSDTAAATSAAMGASDSLVLEEDLIFSCLYNQRLLLVFDSLDELLAGYSEAVTELRLFLHRLFDDCAMIKVLNVGVDTLSFHNISFTSSVIEYSVPMGPLTISSTLRLFARLAPSLTTAHEKQEFINALQTPRQAQVSLQSREMSNTTLRILQLFGEGHPAKIVHMACESTQESVERLKREGIRIKRALEAPEIPHFHVVTDALPPPPAATAITATSTAIHAPHAPSGNATSQQSDER